LDLCTGSGVQALSALQSLGDNTSNALCVDINERALRFVTFNAALNELADQINVRQADLVAGTMTFSKQGVLEELRKASHQMNPERYSEASNFDVILANPPFIPVPPDDDTILQRYGLFSSGGSDGEDVLKAVVHLASELLPSTGGLVGVVSEFMNPPIVAEGDKRLLGRIQAFCLQTSFP
jgi:methylase of polypeptide subunit release factors